MFIEHLVPIRPILMGWKCLFQNQKGEIAIFVLELSREAQIRPSTMKTAVLVIELAISAQFHPSSDVARHGSSPRQHAGSEMRHHIKIDQFAPSYFHKASLDTEHNPSCPLSMAATHGG
jgi:hypothetical protein